MEKLYCRPTECNLHDYEIRAGGVCKYVDHHGALERNSAYESESRILTRPDPTMKLMESMLDRMEDIFYMLSDSKGDTPKNYSTDKPRSGSRYRLDA